MRNLKGVKKLEAIKAHLGREFAYAGDSAADIPIWRQAKGAVLVGTTSRVARAVERLTSVEARFGAGTAGLSTWLRALRWHQWAKNLLLFVPSLTAFSPSVVASLGNVFAAFVAFCLTASATYVWNDIWDLQSDRAHPRKRMRPFASGEIPIAVGVAASLFMLALGFWIAGSVSPSLLMLLALYVVLTTSYSWTLKSYVLIDVILLALLYTLRVFAGSIAAGVSTSPWLLAFSIFIFLSLALVKRCSELVSLKRSSATASAGRDYQVHDLVVLWPLGVGAGLSSIVILGLFISDHETLTRYESPQLLWLAAVGITYWLARLWIKTSRGEMHDDPIVFAARDFGSRFTIGAIVAVVVAAHFIRLP
jgi:4-hydroxybenzoate polyprenyltransferase